MSVKLSTPITGEYEQPVDLFINNEWVKSSGSRSIKVNNPATGDALCTVSEATEEDVDAAVVAARAAFEGPWMKETPENRGRLLSKLCGLVQRDKALLAAIEALQGMNINMAFGEVDIAVSCLQYYAGWADKIEGTTIDTNPETFTYTRREPLGVCGQIIPWNLPLLMLAWKIGPAIATGNTVVLKTAEQTPLSALVFAKLIKEAGFPPGVVNIISGTGEVTGAAMAHHMDIDKIAFTGSNEVGRKILRAAANSNLKKVTLELGGKSPNIVFSDADIDNAISWANWGVFFNAGQVCLASARIYVQAGIYDQFVDRFKTRINAQAMAVGDPFNQSTFYGPLVSQEQFNRVMSYIEAGKADGAVVQAGGGRHGDKGHFVQQTLFTNVTEDMSIMREEIFGPVCAVVKFDTEEEVIRLANRTDFGLAACVHTKELGTSLRVAHAIRAGTVWVNQCNASHWQIPTGGFKQSGIGRECGEEALASYTQTKAVSIRLGGPFFP